MSATDTPRRASARKRLAWVLVVVLLLGGWWFLLRPEPLGGSTTLVTVTGRSMEPGMSTGDLAVVRKGSGYEAGDVVAFRVPREDGEQGGVVIHRIVDGDPETGFRMRGDNNDFYDPWAVTADDIAGEMVLHVPGAGRVVMAMADPALAGATFAALTAFLILMGGGRKDDEPDTAGDPAAEKGMRT